MVVGTSAPSVFDAGLPTLDYDPFSSPGEAYDRLRAAQRTSPVAIRPLGPEVLSYDAARAVLRDTRFGIPPGINLTAMGLTSGPLFDKVVGSLLCLEGAEHQRLRKLVSEAFTPRATARLHDTINEVVNGLIDGVAGDGRCDVVVDIARPYPIPVICALLGAPREDWQRFSVWAEDIFKAFSFSPNLADEEAGVMRAWGELDDYVDDMITRRRHDLTDDLLSDLIRAEDDGDRLNGDELRMLAASLLMAGTDTTRNQLAASIQVLCDHPDQCHYCLGANLARLELAEALGILTRRVPGLRRVGPAPWKPMLGMTRPTSLPVEFETAAALGADA